MPVTQQVVTEVTKPATVHDRIMGFLGESSESGGKEKSGTFVEKATKTDKTEKTPTEKPAEKIAQETPKEEEIEETAPTDETEAPEETEETEETTETTNETEEKTEAVETPPSTQEELAERLGLEPDKLMDVKFKTKIDGQEGETTLADLLRSYQIDSSLNRKAQDIAESRKNFDQEIQTSRNQQSEILGNLRNSLTLALQMLQGEYAAVDWGNLEQTDPNQYLILRQKFQDRNAQIEQAYQTLQQKEQETAQENKGKFESYYQDQQTKLANAIPEWKNDETAKRDKQAIKEYLKGQGYSDQEIGSLYDHRFILVMRDAIRYRDLMKNKAAVTKKIITAPKLSKPGTQKVTDASDSQRYNQQRDQLKKTGKVPRGLLERFV